MNISVLAMCDIAVNGVDNSGDACEFIAIKAIINYSNMGV